MTWKAGTCVLSLAILGVLAYDINLHGNFEKSNTGRILKDTGALQYGNLIWEQTKLASDKFVKWAKINIPIFYNDISTILKPYLQLLFEISIVIYNSTSKILYNLSIYIEDKTPVVQKWLSETTEVLKGPLGEAKKASWVIIDHVQNYTLLAVDYAKKNIFVGSMSPENLRKYTLEAINTTQVYATNTFHWVYEKFQTLSRLEQ